MTDAREIAPDFNCREVTIRAMQRADLAAVIDLDARVFGQERSTYFERRLAMLNCPHAGTRPIFLVAEYRETIIGFVMGTLAQGEFGLAQVATIVDSIAVHPHYQRRGIGQQLIGSFIGWSAGLGATSVYTLVKEDNWDLLKAFHALGFSLAPVVPLEQRIQQADREAAMEGERSWVAM
jgi:GNAT superfamily N-acetyltransferase